MELYLELLKLLAKLADEVMFRLVCRYDRWMEARHPGLVERRKWPPSILK